MTMLRDAVIVATARTPMGRYGGQLKDVRPDDLAAIVLTEVCERARIKPAEVSDVILGCANQAGEDNRNIARMALLLAGFPVEVPGQTVNRLCGSGMQATVAAAREIQTGAADVMIAGGVESMTRAPWVMPKPDGAYPRGPQTAYDTALGWRLVNSKMAELYGNLTDAGAIPMVVVNETSVFAAPFYANTASAGTNSPRKTLVSAEASAKTP